MLPGQASKQQGLQRQAVPIGAVLKSVEYSLKAGRQGLLAVQASLTEILPAELLEQSRVVGVRGGILTLWAADATTKCLLETLLRGQALTPLQNALPHMSLRKVRVVLT